MDIFSDEKELKCLWVVNLAKIVTFSSAHTVLKEMSVTLGRYLTIKGFDKRCYVLFFLKMNVILGICLRLKEFDND